MLSLLVPQAHAQIHAPNSLFVDPALAQNFDLEILLTQIANFFVGFVGVIAIIMLIVGGYYMLASGGNEEMVTKGKKAVTYAVIGIIVIVLAYAIVYTITSGLSDLGGAGDPSGDGGGGLGGIPVFPSVGSIIDLLKIIFDSF